VTQTHRPILEYAGRRFAAYVASREMQEQCCGAGTTASETACRTQFNQTELKVNLGLGADESTGYFGNSSTDTAIHVSLGILVNCTSTDCVDRLFLHELGHACHYLKNQTQQTLPYSESDTRRDFVAARGEDVTQCVQTALQTERNRASQGQQLLNINAEEWFEEALADATFFHLWTTPGSWAWNCNAHQDELHSNPRIYMACLFRIPAVRQNLCGAQGS
jgi:hypothetical protein